MTLSEEETSRANHKKEKNEANSEREIFQESTTKSDWIMALDEVTTVTNTSDGRLLRIPHQFYV